MEHPTEEAPLAADQQVLIQPNVTSGSSGRRALKIAGLTALACLLVASQIFTAYLVFDQKQQIQTLQANTRRMESRMAQRSQVSPQRMVMPISSLPLLDFDDSKPAPKNPLPQNAPPKQDVASPSVEQELQELLKGFEVPHFNKSFLENLQSLKQQSNESDWRSIESWLSHWLIFQMAQKSPPSKCQVEASGSGGLLGAYKPQCDEQGNYKTMQCRHSTGYCWCVDESGSPIKGTQMRGIPSCDQVLASRRTSSDLLMMPGFGDDAKK